MEPVGGGKEENRVASLLPTNWMWIVGVMTELAVPAPCDDLSSVFVFPDMLSEEFSAENGKY